MATDRERYAAACHAMQSGVAFEIQTDPQAAGTSPKHLRVGINTAHVDHASLVTLLVAKGLFTMDEYLTAIADGMEAERDRYEGSLSAHHGQKISLA